MSAFRITQDGVFEISTNPSPIEFKLDLADGPVEFGIPPLDWIPRATMTKYKAWVKKNNRTATEDDANLKLLELVLEAEVYEQVAELPPAVAAAITDRLTEGSEASLGESGASTTS